MTYFAWGWFWLGPISIGRELAPLPPVVTPYDGDKLRSAVAAASLVGAVD